MAEKYISVETAKKLFCDGCDSVAICNRKNGYDCPDLKDFDELISADVAEIVRCRDCKFYTTGTIAMCCARGYLEMNYPGDYCSRGERRTP